MDVLDWLSFLSRYLLVTLELAASSVLSSIVLALGLAVCRLSPWGWLRLIARIEADFFRSVPLLALMLSLYFALGPMVSSLGVSSFWLAVLALTLNESAYSSEVYRGALEAIPAPQWDAAASIGMNWPQTVAHVILPQAVPSGLPATMNLLIAITKDSAMASLIGVPELTLGATVLVSNTFLTLPIYVVVALIYLVVIVPFGYLARYSELFVSRRIGGTPAGPVAPGRDGKVLAGSDT